MELSSSRSSAFYRNMVKERMMTARSSSSSSFSSLFPVVLVLLSLLSISVVEAATVAQFDFYTESATCTPGTNTTTIFFFMVVDRCHRFDIPMFRSTPRINNSLKYNCTLGAFLEYAGVDDCSGEIAGGNEFGKDCSTDLGPPGTSTKINCITYPDEDVVIMEFGTCATPNASGLSNMIVDSPLVVNTCQSINTDVLNDNRFIVTVNGTDLTYTTYSDVFCTTGEQIKYTAKLDGPCVAFVGTPGAGSGPNGVAFRTLNGTAFVAEDNPEGSGASFVRLDSAITMVLLFCAWMNLLRQ